MAKDNKVKLIIGSHGSGKSDWIYNRFLDMSRNENDSSKIDLSKKLILVVPEQDTNDKQRTMIKKSIEKGFGSGILNIDVVSFDRIAHNVFEILNIEPIKENVIDDDMKTMILSLVLSKLAKANKLKYCDKMVNRVGFARKLTQVVSEFYAYSVSSDEIDKVINAKKSDIYRDKLNDFKLIFDEFKKVLIDMHFSIKEDKYDLLDKRIADVNIFDDAIVAFDGFTGFTPIQISIFKKIVSVASEVYVTVDYRDPIDIKTFNIDSDIDDTDLFYLSKKFIKDIAAAVDAKNIEDLLCDDSIKDTIYKYLDNDKKDLNYIEKNLYRTNYKNEEIEVKNIDYFASDNIREEVLNVVQQIFDLVRNKGYKYNDIRIIVPQIENYRNFIIKSFDKYNIPLFIDDSEKIINSPYIEAIRSALDVINYNFSYESIMRYVNSGISEKSREVYEFDNFVLEHAIKGYDRYKTGFDKIKISDDKKEKIYSVKKFYIDPLIKLYEDLSNDKSINSYINAVVNFIKNSELNEKYEILDKEIEDLTESDISYNRISAVFKYSKEVVENVINDLSNLEKYKEKDSASYLASDISIEEFRRMFDAGLSNKALKSIPFSLDQVVVGDLMRSRFDNPKVEFFLGLNQSAIPSKYVDLSLIDDAIRELFASNVKELSQTTIETTLNQRFYIYLAMTNPTDKLILSYTKVNGEGDSDEKSPVLIMIEKMFNKEEGKSFAPKKVDPDSFAFYSYEDLISYAALNMQDMTNYSVKDADGNFTYEFPDEIEKRIVRAKKVLNYLKKDKNYNEISKSILYQPEFYRDIRLNKKLNDDLLNVDKKEFKGSATSIENFNSCPYKFFMEHTLKLKDKKEYKVEPVDIGNIAHSVFENLFKDKKIIEKSSKDLHALVDKNLSELFNASPVFSEFDKKDKDYIGVNKLEYTKSRVIDLMHHTTDILVDMAKAMKFETKETESKFEYNINESADSKDKVVLTGKIDRIDVCDIDGKTYVNVIDYKSGKKEKTLDLKDVEAGTNIQLTLYIDYCLNKKYKKGNDAAIFAGSFYFWVGEGRPRIEDFNSRKSSIDDMKNRLSSENGFSGVSSSDDNIIAAVYDNPVVSKNSRGSISSINLKNGYKIDGKYIDANELNSYIEKMHIKVNETIENIKSGVITAKPYKSNMCNNCPYSNICRKEQLLVDEGSDSEV